MKHITNKLVFPLALIALLLTGCKSLNKTQKGTAIGTAAGAGAGALISKGSIWGTLIGAAVAGGIGYLIGHHMDKQAEEIKQAVPDAQVNRAGEGINMTFNSGLLFKINPANPSDAPITNLSNVAAAFIKYHQTHILLSGP